MRFVSRSVITGFVNALAILIFMAQLPELTNVSWVVYAMTAAGLAIIYGFPYLTRAVPSPLVTIVVLTGVAMVLELDIRTVGDMGQLPDSLPVFLLPDVPLNLETLRIILPYAATLAVVGLLESMMTASIVDDLTDTPSNKNRECVGQGVANIATGFIGGMAGCAMIGQSVINVKSGGRGRLSTFVAGVFLLILVVFLGPWVKQIPMAALVAVMIMVSIGTFSWDSIRKLREHPPSSSLVMIATVVVTVSTHDLAKGVFVGVLLSGIFFAHKVGRVLRIDRSSDDDGRRAHLRRGRPGVLRVGRDLRRRLRLQGSGREGAHRREPRALLGHHRRQRARQGGAEVQARGHRGRGDRPERGQRDAGGPLRAARQARRRRDN